MTRRTSVALVAMPFVSVVRPSLQLGLLSALARRQGFAVTCLHLNLDFAAQTGPELYELLCRHRGVQLGDWIFAEAAFGDTPGAEALPGSLGKDLRRQIEHLADAEATEALLRLRREEVPRYLDALVEGIDWASFDVVGFTSTFQQNVASLALARRLKQAHPHVVNVFGGANFEHPMGPETVRSMPWVDYAVVGEGDEAFPEFLAAVEEERDPAEVPGVCARRDGAATTVRPREPFTRLDDLPTPDYEEYFTRAEHLGLLAPGAHREVDIPFESSRGCWWGAKHHCVFCGLNGATMTYRPKSGRRVRAELAELASRCRSFRFEAVDNILDTGHLRGMIADLAADGTDYRFFYEVKANLSRDHLRTLHAAGVDRIQPGIESLDSHVLTLMRKGVTAARNVNTLRWATHYGIEVGWNLLFGFPGETEDDYRGQAELAGALVHLPPPEGVGRLWLERFSPLFTQQQHFGVVDVRPEDSYRLVYPPEVDLTKMAYFFEYAMQGALPDHVYEPLARAVHEWRRAWSESPRPHLTYWSAPGFVQIEDARDPDNPGTYTFNDPIARLYTACSDRPRGLAAVHRDVAPEWTREMVREALDRLCALRLMMRDGDAYLALALPARAGR